MVEVRSRSENRGGGAVRLFVLQRFFSFCSFSDLLWCLVSRAEATVRTVDSGESREGKEGRWWKKASSVALSPEQNRASSRLHWVCSHPMNLNISSPLLGFPSSACSTGRSGRDWQGAIRIETRFQGKGEGRVEARKRGKNKKSEGGKKEKNGRGG